mgnify:CR=1 FL=1
MNTGMGKLHQMLFYAGLKPEEYQACLPEIRKDNRKKLRAYLIMAGIFLLVIICLLGGLEGGARPSPGPTSAGSRRCAPIGDIISSRLSAVWCCWRSK